MVGNRDFHEVESWVAELTQAQLGVPLSGALFAKKSVGAVFGIVLESGEPAVLKLFNKSLAQTRAVGHASLPGCGGRPRLSGRSPAQ